MVNIIFHEIPDDISFSSSSDSSPYYSTQVSFSNQESRSTEQLENERAANKDVSLPTSSSQRTSGIGGRLLNAILNVSLRKWMQNERAANKDVSLATSSSRGIWGYIPTGVFRQTKGKVLLESCKFLQRYKYSDLMVMTKSFKHILGLGGSSHVFKGTLCNDGRLVAVKVFNDKGKGEDFINEVATNGRTNHVNVVSLLGFCIKGSKRALVYEFMPNGSLEKYIYNKKTSSTHLGWEKLYQIALGIARGLEYLHCRCNTRILHFDIKPHNILLDHDFLPKISDFGLAKLCPTKESIVSMVGARGTMGYIAPELICRNLGGVSHKSDVYSYGMMVMEMIGGRKNLDVTVENMSGIYFPHWIYNRFKQDFEIEEPEEIKLDETAKKMIIVALWCIQTLPVNRPSMTKVVEMLEESNELLQRPPNPLS